MQHSGFRTFRFSVSFFFALTIGWILPQVTHAFSISPVIVDLSIESGNVGQGSVSITNTDDAPATFYVSVQNFVAKGEGGQQDFLPETDRSGLAGWIVPENRQVTLGAKESKMFSYAINVPIGAEPGGHYAAMFFSTVPSRDGSSNAVAVGAKTGVLFFLRVPGNIREDARIESFTSDKDVLNRLPASFEFRVRNLGNVHLRPVGDIVIKNMFGREAATTPLNPQQSAVLPNSIRRLEETWAKTLDISAGGFFSELRNEWSNFAFGKYTAEVNGVYGASQQTLSARTSFWVIPWHVLTVALASLVVLIILFKMYNRRVVKAAMKKSSRISSS